MATATLVASVVALARGLHFLHDGAAFGGMGFFAEGILSGSGAGIGGVDAGIGVAGLGIGGDDKDEEEEDQTLSLGVGAGVGGANPPSRRPPA